MKYHEVVSRMISLFNNRFCFSLERLSWNYFTRDCARLTYFKLFIIFRKAEINPV